MNGEGDERLLLEHTRMVVSRYARQAGWEPGDDQLGDDGWGAVFKAEVTTDEGTAHDELRVWRPKGASHTSFRFRTKLDAARREAALRLVSDHDLAGTVIEEDGGLALITSTRIYDPGLNFETFEHTIDCLFACRDAVQSISM